MSAYWKLWRDVRGRFLVAVFITGTAIYSIAGFPAYVRDVPMMSEWINGICGAAAASPGVTVTTPRAAQSAPGIAASTRGAASGVTKRGVTTRDARQGGLVHQEDFASFHAAECRTKYMTQTQHVKELQQRVSLYNQLVWNTTMPVLTLMLGILLAVGAPFSSEEAEATTLTFSLPWSRARWLKAKMLITFAMLVSLIGGVALLGGVLTHFPTSASLSYLSSVPDLGQVIPALLYGLAGSALGIVATLFTRSALAGAITAYIAMYFIVFVDLSRFTSSKYGMMGSFMDLSAPSGVVTALALIAGGTALAYAHLRAKDL